MGLESPPHPQQDRKKGCPQKHSQGPRQHQSSTGIGSSQRGGYLTLPIPCLLMATPIDSHAAVGWGGPCGIISTVGGPRHPRYSSSSHCARCGTDTKTIAGPESLQAKSETETIHTVPCRAHTSSSSPWAVTGLKLARLRPGQSLNGISRWSVFFQISTEPSKLQRGIGLRVGLILTLALHVA